MQKIPEVLNRSHKLHCQKAMQTSVGLHIMGTAAQVVGVTSLHIRNGVGWGGSVCGGREQIPLSSCQLLSG